MAEVKKSNYKSMESQNNQSMHFWGVCCESGKQYAQVVGQRFRITMAVLDPKSFYKEDSDKNVSLVVIRGGIEYLLCVLKHEEIHQVNLNLIFDKGENVVFYINGHGKVYLSGYQLTDSEIDVLNDENGYLCPLVEVKTPKSKSEKKAKLSKISQKSESVSPKSKKKAKAGKEDLVSSEEKNVPTRSFWNTDIHQDKNGQTEVLNSDDDDDESDEDFSVGDEETESDDDYTSDDDECEEEEELEETDKEDNEEDEIILNSEGSQKKRKRVNLLQAEKRSRRDSTSNSVENSDEVVCLEDDSNDGDLSDYETLNSSIGNTPMPKKQLKFKDSEKKTSKKKRLSEISNISEKPVKSKQLKVSNKAENTPNKTENTPRKNAVQKLEGGVEIQDVITGKGPIAVKGKMVHVFYIGRFQDKKIFDSRLPGKKPFSFKLGNSQVIKGWDIGLQGMSVGGRRKLKIPPSMGYGDRTVGEIPPNSTLYFVVELLSVS